MYSHSTPLFFALVVGALIAWVQVQAQTPLSTLTATTTYTACTKPDTGLANLSFAKALVVVESNFTCTRIKTTPGTAGITWYYYPTYPPSDCTDGCCHTTADSVFNFTTVYRQNSGSNYYETVSGTVVSGPYQGNAVSRVTTAGLANQGACSTSLGLEISAGFVTLNIDNGPSCVGVITLEYCPGIH